MNNEHNNTELDEADIPENAFQDKEEQEVVTCPATGEEVAESPKAYRFKGFPELTCWKTVADREMSAEDYATALFDIQEQSEPTIFDDFKSKAGKKFSAGLKLNDDASKWEFYFPPAEESQHKCPKSGASIEIRDKAYMFKGYPKGGFWKIKSGRKMSIPDYLSIIEADGAGVMFRGFKTKNKEKFDAELILKDGKIIFAFEDKQESSV